MQTFALVGRGISRSLSPILHAAAAQSVGLKVEYTLLDVSPEELESVRLQLVEGVYAGVNVTAPHKVGIVRRWCALSSGTPLIPSTPSSDSMMVIGGS